MGSDGTNVSGRAQLPNVKVHVILDGRKLLEVGGEMDTSVILDLRPSVVETKKKVRFLMFRNHNILDRLSEFSGK